MEVKYSNFSVTVPGTDSITEDNYFKHNYILRKSYMSEYISNLEICYLHAEYLVSGDEEKALAAIDSIIKNREYHINRLQEFQK